MRSVEDGGVKPGPDDSAERSFVAKAAICSTIAASLIGYVGFDMPVRFFEKKADSIPGHLPQSVKSAKDSVVKVFNFSVEDNGSMGTGVKVGKNLVLTAQHVLHNAGKEFSCDSIYSINKNTPSQNVADNVKAWSSIGSSTSGKNDIALMWISPNRYFKRLPSAKTATSKSKKGDVVFFSNYQSNNSGVFEKSDPKQFPRYPNRRLAQEARRNSDPFAISHAAYYAGIVLSAGGGLMQVATSLRGYGTPYNSSDRSRPGGSGGPVWDKKGKLQGIEIRYGKVRSAQILDNRYLVHLPAILDAPISVVTVRTVDNALIKQLEQSSIQAKCK